MLIEFGAKNYKSFGNDLIFSMSKAPRLEELGYSVVEKKVPKIKKIERILSSSVIYGPNASGKSNIISAIEVFKNIVLRGNILNSDLNSIEIASSKLEFIPNINNTDTPSTFYIIFLIDDYKIKYSFSFFVGGIGIKNYERKIISEELAVNEQIVFKRNMNSLELFDIPIINKLNLMNSKINAEVKKIAEKSLVPEELFLENGFKTIISLKLVQMINKFLSKDMIVILRANQLHSSPHVVFEKDKNKLLIDEIVDQAAKIFGVTGSNIGYLNDKDGHPHLVSTINVKGNNNKVLLDANFFESYGTIRFTNLFPILFDTLKEGKVLIMDEFDASIHPFAIMSIISIFHNDEINKKHAQLIFNTHNPIFLNRNIFRRDEIKLVERNVDSTYSYCYRLSDFGTSGPKAVKITDNYLDKYLNFNYGAINDIDFSDFFEKIITENNNE